MYVHVCGKEWVSFDNSPLEMSVFLHGSTASRLPSLGVIGFNWSGRQRSH